MKASSKPAKRPKETVALDDPEQSKRFLEAAKAAEPMRRTSALRRRSRLW